jgi:hypothetical protein
VRYQMLARYNHIHRPCRPRWKRRTVDVRQTGRSEGRLKQTCNLRSTTRLWRTWRRRWPLSRERKSTVPAGRWCSRSQGRGPRVRVQLRHEGVLAAALPAARLHGVEGDPEVFSRILRVRCRVGMM